MASDGQQATIGAISDSAREFLAGHATLQRLRRMRGAAGWERDTWQLIARQGWLGIALPESRGGLGLGWAEVCAVAEQVGRHLLPEPFVACGVQPVALCSRLPDTAAALPFDGLADGRIVAAVAATPEGGVADEGGPVLRPDPEGALLRLSGRVRHVAAPPDVDGWIVHAHQDGDDVLAWIPRESAGCHAVAEHRADGLPSSVLTLDRVAVAPAQVLARGQVAARALRASEDLARIAQSAELLGVGRSALHVSLDYVRTRRQFGRPIGSFQALQHRLVDAFIQLELAQAALQACLAGLDDGDAPLARAASRAKARAAHAAMMATRLGIQVHGAMGFTDACDIGLYFKRALVLSAWLGNAAFHRARFAASSARADASGAAAPALGDELGYFDPTCTDWDSVPEDVFRAVVSRFIREKFPAALIDSPYRVRWNEIRGWFMALSRQGWIAPAWPKEHGGMGLPPDKLLAYVEEMERHGVARAPDQGILMLGPLLIRFGTEAQRREFLPRILSGEHIWCQGYSEPEAGSDLASLRTEAVADGDDYVVNGQKIWSTLAHDATHMFMLVRTDKEARPQRGISFLLVDLATPGITVRPIPDITGHEEFCEVFFRDVRVPKANLVGAPNEGWTMAKALLGFERLYSGSPKQAQYALSRLRVLARARGLFDDPVFGARFAEVELDASDAAAAYMHFAAIVKRGGTLPPSISYLKVWATETYQRISMLLSEAAGEAGAGLGPQHFGASTVDVLAPLFNATPATIYGGSNEIQRNILARYVLELPT